MIERQKRLCNSGLPARRWSMGRDRWKARKKINWSSRWILDGCVLGKRRYVQFNDKTRREKKESKRENRTQRATAGGGARKSRTYRGGVGLGPKQDKRRGSKLGRFRIAADSTHHPLPKRPSLAPLPLVSSRTRPGGQTGWSYLVADRRDYRGCELLSAK